jgi:hypothetical protein
MLGYLLTLGFLRLVFYWKPEWMTKCTHRPCHTRHATTALLRDKYQQWFVEDVELLKYSSSGSRDDLDSLNQSKSSAKHRQPPVSKLQQLGSVGATANGKFFLTTEQF